MRPDGPICVDGVVAGTAVMLCTVCRRLLPTDRFYRRTNGRPKSWCIQCSRAKALERHAAARRSGVAVSANRRRHLATKYRLTPADFVRMLHDQGDRCAICRRFETQRARNGGVRRLSIDHCHVTGRVRGLLCGRCNRAIGLFGDESRLLRAAATYLEGYAC